MNLRGERRWCCDPRSDNWCSECEWLAANPEAYEDYEEGREMARTDKDEVRHECDGLEVIERFVDGLTAAVTITRRDGETLALDNRESLALARILGGHRILVHEVKPKPDVKASLAAAVPGYGEALTGPAKGPGVLDYRPDPVMPLTSAGLSSLDSGPVTDDAVRAKAEEQPF